MYSLNFTCIFLTYTDIYYFNLLHTLLQYSAALQDVGVLSTQHVQLNAVNNVVHT